MPPLNTFVPITVGDVTIQPIVEQEGAFFDALKFFPSLTSSLLEENRHWMEPVYLEAGGTRFFLRVQSFLVRTRHHTILVDTCVGNHKPRPALPFWDQFASDRYEKNLAGAGVSVGDIDVVMCTHLHTDHVGWNTRLENGRWVPTFPNARYLFSERELQFWTERHANNPEACPWITDSVLPIVAAHRSDLVANNHVICDGVEFVSTPGHTIDHCSLLVSRQGSDAFITGDMIHSPLQARYPDIGMQSDYDSALAGATRRNIFERFDDTPALICAAHFPGQSTGRFHRWDNGYRFVPVEP